MDKGEGLRLREICLSSPDIIQMARREVNWNPVTIITFQCLADSLLAISVSFSDAETAFFARV